MMKLNSPSVKSFPAKSVNCAGNSIAALIVNWCGANSTDIVVLIQLSAANALALAILTLSSLY